MNSKLFSFLSRGVKNIAVALLLASMSSVALSHGRWILPDRTILSGEKQYVSIDLSISNDIFHPDVPMGGVSLMSASQAKQPAAVDFTAANTMGELIMLMPDGEQSSALPLINAGRKSVSVAELEASGSYRLRMVQPPLMLTFYKDAKGKMARMFGGYQQVKERLPEGASDISTLRLHHYLESYLTLNDVSEKALKPTGRGLEVRFSQHPNALFVNESATLSFLLDGEPVAEGVPVRITAGGTRFRNNRNAQELLTNKLGQVDVTWNTPGMLLIEAELDSEVDAEDYDQEGHHLFVTLEINPE